jgi:hypothetical protein
MPFYEMLIIKIVKKNPPKGGFLIERSWYFKIL